MTLFQIGSVSISLVDIIIFAICMISAVSCCIKGFVMELSKWAGIIVGLISAVMFLSMAQPHMASLLPESFPPIAVAAITFIVLFFTGFLIVILVGKMLRKIVETFRLGALDNILGFIWGLIISLLAVTVIIHLLTLQSLFDVSGILDSSVIYTRIISVISPQALSTIETLAESGMQTIQEVSGNAV